LATFELVRVVVSVLLRDCLPDLVFMLDLSEFVHTLLDLDRRLVLRFI